MAADAAWLQSLRTHPTKGAKEFHRAKDRHEMLYYAAKLSEEKDRNESPAILQYLYNGNRIYRTVEDIKAEHDEKLERLREKYGPSAVANVAQFNPFIATAFDEDDNSDDDDKNHNLVFSSKNYRFSQRLVNALEKGKSKRLRSLPNKGYNNHFLWSMRSIGLEEGIRQIPILLDLSLDKLMKTFDRIHSGSPISFVDTFWACKTGKARYYGLPANAKDSLGRLSNFTERIQRFDSAVTKVINSRCLCPGSPCSSVGSHLLICRRLIGK